MTFSPSQYEGTPLYEAFSQAIEDLIENKDLFLNTPHEKIVDYLVRKTLEVKKFNLPIHRKVM